MAVKTNNFYPPDGMMRIPMWAINDIFTKGFAYIPIPGRGMRKVTEADLLFEVEEIHELARKIESGEIKLKEPNNE
jgi:hypothetical protein